MSAILFRVRDVAASALGLTLLSPVLLGVAIAVRVDSPGPALYRQERVGLGGEHFRIHKFRSMVADSRGLELTAADDDRITRVGRVIRRAKLDELPQLVDVLIGNMSLVGPRPEVPRYVNVWPDDVREKVLSIRPGITDPASIKFRDEEDLLRSSKDPEHEYLEVILPQKLAIYCDYVNTRTVMGDFAILLRTIRAVLMG